MVEDICSFFSQGSNKYSKHGGEEGNSGTPHKAFQSNGLLQRNFSDGWDKEDVLMDKRHETPRSIDYNLKDISPLKRLLSAEQKISSATFNSPSFSALVTPHSKLSNYKLSTGSMKFGKILLSKQISISKFRLPESSPHVSSNGEGTDRLNSRPSRYSSLVNLSGQGDQSKDLEHNKYIDIPVVCLEEQLTRSNGNNNEFKSSFSTSGSGVKTTKDFPKLSQSEEPKGLAEAGETPDHMDVANFPNVQPIEPATEAKSPVQATWTENKDLMPHILMSEDPLSRSSTSSEIDDLTNIRPDGREQNNSTNMYDTIVSSPSKSLDVRLSGATECSTSCFGELNQCNQQDKLVRACLTQGGAAPTSNTRPSPLNLIADNSGSLQSKIGTVSTSPLLKGMSLVDGDDNGVDLSNLHNNSETFSNLQHSLRNGNIVSSHLESPAKTSKLGAFSPQFQKAWTSGLSIMQVVFSFLFLSK